MPKLPNLSKFSRDQLSTLIKDAEKEIARKQSEDLRAAKKAAQVAAKAHGFNLAELLELGKGGKAPAPAKYQNPDDASQTWSGRGRQPEWYKKAIAGGKAPEDMLI